MNPASQSKIASSLDDKSNVAQFITFRVARRDFVMDATRIRGLLPMHDAHLLDKPHGWIVGFASIRGHEFPIIDLRGKFRIARGTHGRQPCVVVVETAGARLAGFVADRVSEVLNLRNCDLSRGTLRIAGRTRRVLDPDRVLAEEAVTL